MKVPLWKHITPALLGWCVQVETQDKNLHTSIFSAQCESSEFYTANNNASALLILSLVKDVNLFDAEGIPGNTWKEIIETSGGEKNLKSTILALWLSSFTA